MGLGQAKQLGPLMNLKQNWVIGPGFLVEWEVGRWGDGAHFFRSLRSTAKLSAQIDAVEEWN